MCIRDRYRAKNAKNVRSALRLFLPAGPASFVRWQYISSCSAFLDLDISAYTAFRNRSAHTWRGSHDTIPLVYLVMTDGAYKVFSGGRISSLPFLLSLKLITLSIILFWYQLIHVGYRLYVFITPLLVTQRHHHLKTGLSSFVERFWLCSLKFLHLVFIFIISWARVRPTQLKCDTCNSKIAVELLENQFKFFYHPTFEGSFCL